jgi:hypothetical protein
VQGLAWYHAYLCGPARLLVAVIDHEVPLPSTDLEIRTTGLWATHICETPLDHWTVGLEAFALEVDDPGDLYGRQLGRSVPLGYDLEWEAVAVADDRSGPGVGYHQHCRVSGEVLVGDRSIDLDGSGHREHRWGPASEWDQRWFRARGRLDDGTRFAAHLPGGDLASACGSLDGAPVEVDAVAQRTAAPGVPRDATVVLGGCELRLEALAVTTLELVDPEGRRTRAPRAMCRVAAAGGRTGAGWFELNEPVP